MAVQPFSSHLPAPPYTLDLGEHTLTINSDGLTIAKNADSTSDTQQVQLDDIEMYRLHVTLQLLYAR